MYASFWRTTLSLAVMILSIEPNIDSFRACSKSTNSVGSGETVDGCAWTAVWGIVSEMHLQEEVRNAKATEHS